MTQHNVFHFSKHYFLTGVQYHISAESQSLRADSRWDYKKNLLVSELQFNDSIHIMLKLNIEIQLGSD